MVSGWELVWIYHYRELYVAFFAWSLRSSGRLVIFTRSIFRFYNSDQPPSIENCAGHTWGKLSGHVSCFRVSVHLQVARAGAKGLVPAGLAVLVGVAPWTTAGMMGLAGIAAGMAAGTVAGMAAGMGPAGVNLPAMDPNQHLQPHHPVLMAKGRRRRRRHPCHQHPWCDRRDGRGVEVPTRRLGTKSALPFLFPDQYIPKNPKQ